MERLIEKNWLVLVVLVLVGQAAWAGWSEPVLLEELNDTTNGYISFEAQLDNSAAIPYQDRPGTDELDPYWPECSYTVESTSNPNTYHGGCISSLLPPFPESTYKNVVMKVDYNCPASPSMDTVTMAPPIAARTLTVSM